MRKYFRLTSLLLALIMLFSSTLPAFAYETDDDNNSIAEIIYGDYDDDDPSTGAFAEVGSYYKVTIPKVIVLSGETKMANYYVKAEGDIAGYETLYVVPDNAVNLYSNRKNMVIGNILQDKIAWRWDTFDIDANGLVKAKDITAGKWSGVFYFNIYLYNGEEDFEPEEMVLGDVVDPPLDLEDDYRLIINKLSTEPGTYDEDLNLIESFDDIFNLPEGTSKSYDKWKKGEFDLGGLGYNNAGPHPLTTLDLDDINNHLDGVTYIAFPEGIETLGGNLLNGSNASGVKYVYIPSTVKKIESGFGNGSGLSHIFAGKGTNISSDALSNTPARNNDNIYSGGKRLISDVDINLNDLPSRLEDVDMENPMLTLEKGCRYQITALYNFYNDVTKESSIVSSDNNIVSFVPECYLDANECGTCIISGTYASPNGEKNAYISIKVIDTKYSEGREKGTEPINDKIKIGNTILPAIEEWNNQTLPNKIEMEINSTKTIRVPEKYKNSIVITSSKSDIVKIEDNVIKATKHGESIITYTIANKSISTIINVTDPEYQTMPSEGGLYDDDYNLIKSWDELVALGLQVERDHTSDPQKGYYYRTWLSSGYYVFTTNNLSGNLVIPNTIKHIGNYVFCECKGLKSITIPNSVTDIGAYAFSKCTNLESVILPNSITQIGHYAFNDCTKLSNINLPDSIKEIGIGTFKGCTNLESVILPNNLTQIESYVFNNCSNLKSINIPDSVTGISSYAFEKCNSLESITLPDNVTRIGGCAFLRCANLKTVTMPDCITEIGKWAFRECTNLSSINIPSGITKIDEATFYSCTSLKTIIIPEGVTEIYTYTSHAGAFYNCTNLESVTLPSTLKKIYSDSFAYCSKLTVTLPANIEYIGSDAFKNVKRIYYTGSVAGRPWGALAMN